MKEPTRTRKEGAGTSQKENQDCKEEAKNRNKKAAQGKKKHKRTVRQKREGNPKGGKEEPYSQKRRLLRR